LDHLRRDQVDQPVVGHDVVVQNFAKLLVSNASLRTVIGIAGGVAHQHIDSAPMALGLRYQIGQIVFRRDVGGYRYRTVFAVFVLDGFNHLFTRGCFARRHHNFGTVLGHS
jgi:hypothetical protein